MTYKWLFFAMVFPFLLVGCKKADTTAATPTVNYYDPKIPGGQITSDAAGLAGRVSNFAADNSQLNQITLKWTVPPMYKTMDYQVYIYKKAEADSTFVLPEPSEEASGAYIYLLQSLAGNTLLDSAALPIPNQSVVEGGVYENSTYTYWAYVKVTTPQGVKWSPGVKLTVTAKSPTDTFKFPDPSKFWENYTYAIGEPAATVQGSKVINIGSMAPGIPLEGSPTGGIAIAYSGNIMYYADTLNNRVVLYTRD